MGKMHKTSPVSESPIRATFVMLIYLCKQLRMRKSAKQVLLAQQFVHAKLIK